MPFRASHKVSEKPVKQKEETRRSKYDKCPSPDMVLEHVSVDEVEGHEASDCDRGSQTFLPPRYNHSDSDADRKENKSEPLCATYL